MTANTDQEIAAAIKALRHHFGESQQAFSNRLGVVLRTVARWETEKTPKGKALQKLVSLATQENRKDLAHILEKALYLNDITGPVIGKLEQRIYDLEQERDSLLRKVGRLQRRKA